LYKELKINAFINVQSVKYYILSIGFTNTRVFCDLITENKMDSVPTPKTYRDGVIQLIKDIDSGIEFCNLYINNNLCKSRNIIFRHLEKEDIKKNKMLKSVGIPKELMNKNITLIRMNFEPIMCLEELSDIKNIKLIKKGKKENILIEKDMELPIGVLDESYKITYTSKEDKSDIKSLNIKELSIRENKLYIKIEANKDIFDFQVFTYEQLKQVDLLKMRGIIPANKIENLSCREGYHILEQFIGELKENVTLTERNKIKLHFLAVRSFNDDNKEYILYEK